MKQTYLPIYLAFDTTGVNNAIRRPMKNSIFKMLTLFFCFSTLCLYADGEIRDESTGVTFPRTVSFDHDGKQYNLDATGVATRGFKVYSVASYLQKGQRRRRYLQTILQDSQAKQLTMKWVHEASADKVKNGYMESFRKVLSEAQMNQLQNEINTFHRLF